MVPSVNITICELHPIPIWSPFKFLIKKYALAILASKLVVPSVKNDYIKFIISFLNASVARFRSWKNVDGFELK